MQIQNIEQKESFAGQSPTPFIGHYGYPHVNVGLLAPGEVKQNVWEYDAPRFWAKNNYDINKVIGFRSSLINARTKAQIKERSKIVELAQEVGMAAKPVELEINLQKKPKFYLNMDPHAAPTGPNAALKLAKLTANPKVERKVDKVVSDTDLKAAGALQYLYKSGYDENFLSRALSVGNFGIGKNRKLVPTRWSITATDDTIGKEIIEEIKMYPDTGYEAYFGDYNGNFFLVMCFPDKWSYELFEMYTPKQGSWTTDYEGFEGRSMYALETAGGYYACRLSILDMLKERKRQASVLVLRFITPDYSAPLGVWVVREGTRKATLSKPIEFGSKELMLKYATALAKRKFNYDVSPIIGKSRLLKNLHKQQRLSSFV